jgi:flagellar biosynthesis chaperone FliJ
VSPGRYPLAALLELRGALREQARRAVADALRSLSDRERERAAAQASCSALASEHEDLTGHLYDPDPAGLLPIPLVERRTAALRNVEERLQLAQRTAAASCEAVSAAEAELAVRRQSLVEADSELRAAEKHHEAWRAERQQERARKEQRQSDEVTLARFAAEAGSDDGADQGRAR